VKNDLEFIEFDKNYPVCGYAERKKGSTDTTNLQQGHARPGSPSIESW